MAALLHKKTAHKKRTESSARLPRWSKKPKAVTLDVLGTSGTVDPLAQTFTLSDTGTFSKDMFSVGKDGVTNSPLSHGEISALRLDDLDLGRLLGKGASSRLPRNAPADAAQPLALKVLQDLEREQAARTRW